MENLDLKIKETNIGICNALKLNPDEVGKITIVFEPDNFPVATIERAIVMQGEADVVIKLISMSGEKRYRMPEGEKLSREQWKAFDKRVEEMWADPRNESPLNCDELRKELESILMTGYQQINNPNPEKINTDKITLADAIVELTKVADEWDKTNPKVANMAKGIIDKIYDNNKRLKELQKQCKELNPPKPMPDNDHVAKTVNIGIDENYYLKLNVSVLNWVSAFTLGISIAVFLHAIKALVS